MAATLRLKKDQDRRLRAGHCWVYSGEVDQEITPLTDLQPGDPVHIVNAQKKWLGSGYANPGAQVCARLVSRDRERPLGPELLARRIEAAVKVRERLYVRPFYRAVYGESDGLPGLVVDRYGDLAVIQITTAGMERLKYDIAAAVEKVLRPTGILLRNDRTVREAEGLQLYTETLIGKVPETVEITENGVRFRAPVVSGQKTGWYFDQSESRLKMLRFVAAKRVLDVFSYVGGWGVQAAAGGASQVMCLDISGGALAAVEENAEINGLSDVVSTLHGDAFALLKELRDQKERFDVVILDPPAFIQRSRDKEEGTLAYRRLNQLGLQLLNPEGFLITSSCSYHMSRDSFLRNIQRSSRHTDYTIQLLEQGYQAPDHPVHPAIPETEYLKTFFLRTTQVF